MLYRDFSEVEADIKEKAPKILYKYRDWENSNHQKILTENVLWFANPKDLNDPYDIRRPVQLDYSEVDHPIFYQKLKEYLPIVRPSILPDHIEVIASNQLEIIKKDPRRYFEENFESVRKSATYDVVGLLSLTENPVDETMWAYYGANSRGFCVGFNSVQIARMVTVLFGRVRYSDDIISYSFIKKVEDNLDEVMTKQVKWQHEKEWRFISFAVEKEQDRRVKFDKSMIREIVFGSKCPTECIEAIQALICNDPDFDVELYRLKENLHTFGFTKIKILSS